MAISCTIRTLGPEGAAAAAGRMRWPTSCCTSSRPARGRNGEWLSRGDRPDLQQRAVMCNGMLATTLVRRAGANRQRVALRARLNGESIGQKALGQAHPPKSRRAPPLHHAAGETSNCSSQRAPRPGPNLQHRTRPRLQVAAATMRRTRRIVKPVLAEALAGSVGPRSWQAAGKPPSPQEKGGPRAPFFGVRSRPLDQRNRRTVPRAGGRASRSVHLLRGSRCPPLWMARQPARPRREAAGLCLRDPGRHTASRSGTATLRRP